MKILFIVLCQRMEVLQLQMQSLVERAQPAPMEAGGLDVALAGVPQGAGLEDADLEKGS